MLALIGLVLGCHTQQPRVPGLCQHRACNHGGQAPQQRDRHGPTCRICDVCVAGVSDVGASGGRLTLAWNRWCLPPWRSIDVSAVVLAAAGIVAAVIHSASVTRASRFGLIALFVVIGVRIVRRGPMRILALVTLAMIVAGLFGGELLDTIGVPGIWFPFGIGVSRTRYVYAIALLLALIVRTCFQRTHR